VSDDHRPAPPNARGASSLDDETLRRIHAMRERGLGWADVDASLGREGSVKSAYLRAVRGGALAAALATAAPGPGSPAAVEAVADTSAAAIADAADTGDALRVERAADGGMTVEAPASSLIRTLDELLAVAGVDLDLWMVERQLLNAWASSMKGPDGEPRMVQLHQVKAWLVPRRDVVNAKAIIDQMIEDATGHMPRYAIPAWSRPSDEGDLLLEVNLSDAHIGMLAWGPETGGSDYDSVIARRDWTVAVAEIIDRARVRRVSEILLPIGNDFLHADATIDGKGGATTKGTPQDVDTRWQRMVKIGREVLVETIDALRLVAPVRVRTVPGNHDHRTMILLGEVMSAWYRHDSAVVVENEPDLFSCYEWGSVLLGYCHGHGVKDSELPMIMARRWPEAWSRTRWREWHRGHRHRASAVGSAPLRHDLFEDQGVRVVGVSGMTATDSFHASHGYHHIRAAEGRIWSKKRGPMDLFTVWIDPHE